MRPLVQERVVCLVQVNELHHDTVEDDCGTLLLRLLHPHAVYMIDSWFTTDVERGPVSDDALALQAGTLGLNSLCILNDQRVLERCASFWPRFPAHTSHVHRRAQCWSSSS